jgi:polyvinyl alcohol dehydrogenase (cytochrome)
VKSLMSLGPEAIYTAVTTGIMAVPAANLTDEQKRQVAEYLGGRPLDLTDSGRAESMPNRCASNPSLGDPSTGPAWNGWGAVRENTRFQTAKSAGLTLKQVPELKLKWAFGFPHGVSAYGQPTVVAGRIFLGSDIGYVYSLDASTGCVYWSYQAKSSVRTAMTVAPVKGSGGTKYAVYFGDMRGNAYALDASTGRLLWTQRVADHFLSRITGAPALYEGRLYVPVSAFEERFGEDLSYPCCTFRGSVVALDASTGEQLWKTFVIPEEPKPTKKNSRGVQLWGPAGAAVWNSPTIDAKRQALYVGTGNAYTEPAAKTSDSIVALDLKTGKFIWSSQAIENDAFMNECPKDGSGENCPKDLGVDHDYGSSPILLNTPKGRMLLATSKGGTVFALDPDRNGALIWKLNLAEQPPGVSGLIAFGGAADAQNVYLALEDGTFAAVNLATGEQAWRTRLETLDELAPGNPNRTKAGLRFGQSAAVTGIPGAVFTGGWDGILRALSTSDGKVLWQFNTAQSFTTVNGIPAKGGSMGGPGPSVVNGMLYVGSGYIQLGSGLPGNVLLAFTVGSPSHPDHK